MANNNQSGIQELSSLYKNDNYDRVWDVLSFADRELSNALIEKPGIFGRAKDAGIDLAKGVVGLGQSVVGIAELEPTGLIRKGFDAIGYDPVETDNFLSSLYSEGRKDEESAYENANGLSESFGTLIKNPAVLVGQTLQSAPSMLGIMGTSRMILGRVAASAYASAIESGAAQDVAAAIARKAGEKAAIWAGGIGEGIQQTGQSFDQAIKNGDNLGRAYVASLASGAIDAVISVGGGSVGKMIGFGDVEAGLPGKGGFITRAGKGFIQEGLFEETPQSTQEQIWQNYSSGKPLFEGITKSGVSGLLSGGLMGATMGGGVNRPNTESSPPPLNDQEKAQLIDIARQEFDNGNITADALNEIKNIHPDLSADIDDIVNSKIIDEVSQTGDINVINKYSPAQSDDLLNKLSPKEETSIYNKIDEKGRAYRDFNSGGIVHEGEVSNYGMERLYPPGTNLYRTDNSGGDDGSGGSPLRKLKPEWFISKADASAQVYTDEANTQSQRLLNVLGARANELQQSNIINQSPQAREALFQKFANEERALGPAQDYGDNGYNITQVKEHPEDTFTKWQIDIKPDFRMALGGIINDIQAGEHTRGFKATEGHDATQEDVFIGAYSTYPTFMQNKGWTANEVINALKKAQKGEALGYQQASMVESAIDYLNELEYNALREELLNEYSEEDIRRSEEEADSLINQQAQAFEVNPEELTALFEFKAGQDGIINNVPDLKTTGEAVEFAKVATPKQLEKAAQLSEKWGKDARRLLDENKFNEAMVAATKAQLYREVGEAKAEPERFEIKNIVRSAQERKVENAEGIRENERQIPEGRIAKEGGTEEGGPNMELKAQGQSGGQREEITQEKGGTEPWQTKNVNQNQAEENGSKVIGFKTYDEAQNAIDDYETELINKGKSDAEMDKDEYLKSLYDSRNKIGQAELEQSYNEISNAVNTEILDKEFTDKILRNIYDIDPSNPTGQYFAAKYTQRQVKNRANTREKILNAVKEDYGQKNNIDMDGVFSSMSGLSKPEQRDLLKQLTNKASKIESTVYEYFNGKEEASPKTEEKSVQPIEFTESGVKAKDIAALEKKYNIVYQKGSNEDLGIYIFDHPESGTRFNVENLSAIEFKMHDILKRHKKDMELSSEVARNHDDMKKEYNSKIIHGDIWDTEIQNNEIKRLKENKIKYIIGKKGHLITDVRIKPNGPHEIEIEQTYKEAKKNGILNKTRTGEIIEGKNSITNEWEDLDIKNTKEKALQRLHILKTLINNKYKEDITQPKPKPAGDEEREGENYNISRSDFEDMAQRQFNTVREFYREDGIRTWREYLDKIDSDTIALEIESNYEIYNRYLRKLPEGIYAVDIVEAYKQNALPEQSIQKEKTPDIALSEIEAKPLGTLGEPSIVEKISKPEIDILWAKANERITSKNNNAVLDARSEIFKQFALTDDFIDRAEIKRTEIIKKLRSWSAIPASAVDLHQRINRNLSTPIQWHGVINSAWISKQKVSPENIDILVKEVQAPDKSWGSPNGERLRNYISRVILGLDTRILFNDLTFKVTSTLKPLGQYFDNKKLIEIRNDSPHTVAHEVGHYIDHKWANEAVNGHSSNAASTLLDTYTGKITPLREQWLNRFNDFIIDISSRSEIGSEYYQDRGEVFARFFSKFIDWVNEQAGQKTWGQSQYVNDRFTTSDYYKFIKLLQEKAYVDIKEPIKIETQETEALSDKRIAYQIKDEHSGLLQDLKGKMDKVSNALSIGTWKNKKKDLRPITDILLSTPLHSYDRIPTMGRIFDTANEKVDINNEVLDSLTRNPETDEVYTRIIELTKKNDPEMYKKWTDYRVNQDKNQIGYKIRFNPETGKHDLYAPDELLAGEYDSWAQAFKAKSAIKEPSWIVKTGDKYNLYKSQDKPVASYDSDAEALKYSRLFEAKEFMKENNASEEMMKTFLAEKTMLDNGFNVQMQAMRDLIQYYKDNDLPMPSTPVTMEGETVQVNLEMALAMMGDRRGYYFPRIRNQGQFMLSAKKGNKKWMDFYDLGSEITEEKSRGNLLKQVLNSVSPMGKKARELRNQGYEVTIEKAERTPEEVFVEQTRRIINLQTEINDALKAVKKGKVSFESLGFQIEKYKGTNKRGNPVEFLTLDGNTNKHQREMFKEFGGEYYAAQKGEKEAWHFRNPGKSFESRLLKALATVSNNVELETVNMFAQELIDSLATMEKGRGARSHMISRDTSRGDDVWEGYETDPLIAASKYVAGIAGSEAKKIMSGKLMRQFFGIDITWKEFKAAKSFEGSYNEFVEDQQKQGNKVIMSETEYADINDPEGYIENQKELASLKEQIANAPDGQDIADLVDQKQKAYDWLYSQYRDMVDERRIDSQEQTNAWKDGKSFIENMIRNEESTDRIMGFFKGLAVLKYLAGRGSAPIINLTALATSAPGAMNAFGDIPITTSLNLIQKYARKYGQYMLTKNGRDKLTEDEQWVFDQIKAKGWDSATFNREALTALETKTGKAWRRLIELSMLGFGVTERLNRASTIAGTYFGLMETKPDMSKTERLKLAKDISDKAHGVYNKSNMPAWARGSGIAGNLARSFYVFKTFSHNYLQTMAKAWGPGWTPEHAKAFSFMALAPAILGGAGAMVGKEVIIQLAKALGLGGDDPEEEFYKFVAENFGETSEDVARFGLAGLAGINLKGSLEIGITDLPTTLQDFMGAPGSIVKDIYEGGVNISKGNIIKGLENIMPLAIANPIKGIREATEGLTTKANAPIFYGKKPIVADTVDALLRMFSFNPAELSEIREKQWSEKQVEQKYTERRADIYSKARKYMLQPYEKRNEADWIEIIDQIQKYNDRLKENGYNYIPKITNKSLKNNLRRALRPSKKERMRETED